MMVRRHEVREHHRRIGTTGPRHERTIKVRAYERGSDARERGLAIVRSAREAEERNEAIDNDLLDAGWDAFHEYIAAGDSKERAIDHALEALNQAAIDADVDPSHASAEFIREAEASRRTWRVVDTRDGLNFDVWRSKKDAEVSAKLRNKAKPGRFVVEEGNYE